MRFFLIFLLLFSGGCGFRDSPPFITAKVVYMNDNEKRIDNFNFLYKWEERGETPFLKTHSLRSKDVILEIFLPSEDRPQRVYSETVKIPLNVVSSISNDFTASGMEISVKKKNGETITGTDRFPRILKKDEKSGLADYKIFITGMETTNGKKTSFEAPLNVVKKIEILEVSM